MDNQLFLDFTPSRPNDLPPMWDGHPVVWDEVWEEHMEPFICPPPKDPRTCEHCGSTWKLLKKAGRYQVGVRSWRTKYNEKRSGPDVRHLIAYRCVDCGVDVVTTGGQGDVEVWVLDADDYLDSGSYIEGSGPLQVVRG